MANARPQRDAMDNSLTWALQALLVRHETYVADAEKERERMTAEIARLSSDKQELEKTNAVVIEENRNLLDQLESTNNAVAESDTHIQSLMSTLHSTQDELQRLALLSSRTERLERELEQYERDQAALHESLSQKTEEEKVATLRWRNAERTLSELEDQLEKIEREAREEKERHVEVMGRYERRRAVEKELDTAAGRLKGSAAAKTTGHGTNVVSHFVKDILQDNANLQVGIVELREMLANSNDEVEKLRQQIAQLSPRGSPREEIADNPIANDKRNNLGQELSRANSSELHVHHHFHAPPAGPGHLRVSSQPLRRPKKKRHSLTAGHFTPPSGARTPQRSSISGMPQTPSSAATILSQTQATIPPTRHPRWSMQSERTISSIPSSPQSYQPSVFDRGFSDVDANSSRPTTPDSDFPESPMWSAVQAKRNPYRNSTTPSFFSQYELTPLDPPSENGESSEADRSLPNDKPMVAVAHHAIPEETPQDLESPDQSTHDLRKTFIDDTNLPLQNAHNIYARQPLRRTASQESLLSVSGMDIHTLQSRPAQLLTSALSSQPIVSATVAHAARPALLQRGGSDRSRSLLSGMAADQRAPPTPVREGFGRKVGGWVWGRWGGATPTSPGGDTIEAAKPKPSEEAKKAAPPLPPQAKVKVESKERPRLRPPGINQSGPILGFFSEPVLSRTPVLKTLDEEGLRESLME
ncbi:hypothetical protein M8818_007620 [Zalaria obscura]|uniref:Uncharacterized protein n=1 Tax=Zalaria obscura TaxID=2024903 RepID=A0ACC3S3N6_9PEZI